MVIDGIWGECRFVPPFSPDESNPKVVSEIERLFAKREGDLSVTNQLVEICRKSYQLESRPSKISFPVKIDIGSYLKKIRSALNNFVHHSPRGKTP